MAKTINTRIKHKHDLEVNWLKARNFIPLEGELIIYDAEVELDGSVKQLPDGTTALPEGRSTPFTYARIKVGDGVHYVSDLEFSTEKDLATVTEDGLMSKEDKEYIDSIKNAISSTTYGTTTIEGLTIRKADSMDPDMIESNNGSIVLVTGAGEQEFIVGSNGQTDGFAFKTGHKTAMTIDTDYTVESQSTTINTYAPTVVHAPEGYSDESSLIIEHTGIHVSSAAKTKSIGSSDKPFDAIFALDIHGDLDGTAAKATCDASGNNITNTYETKADAADKLATAKEYIDTALSSIGNLNLHGKDGNLNIIEDADKMTVQAQNAFLLTLEEPPAYAGFILLCENAGALPDAQSRAADGPT